MKCRKSYPIAHLENSSPITLKMATILRYCKVCLGGKCETFGMLLPPLWLCQVLFATCEMGIKQSFFKGTSFFLNSYL